jgi:hypothetical protein
MSNSVPIRIDDAPTYSEISPNGLENESRRNLRVDCVCNMFPRRKLIEGKDSIYIEDLSSAIVRYSS